MTWRPIPSAPAYEASDDGQIRRSQPGPSTRVGKVLRSAPGQRYLGLSLSHNGTVRHASVHELVCEAFHGPRPKDHEVGHGDGNPHNNRAANLRWVTSVQNAADRERHGRTRRGENHPNARLTDAAVAAIRSVLAAATTRLQRYGLNKRLATEHGVSVSTIENIAYGKRRMAREGVTK